MKKILGIIAEYNPFHNGHLYQIQKAKEESNADFIIALISSSFVQRGELSIYSSYERAKMAVKNGISAVFEMPAYFSSSSAESFAFYGVDFFNKLGLDYISFGSESANYKHLYTLSNILNKESENFKQVLKDELKKGYSYPKSRQIAFEKIEKAYNIDFSNILNNPNNILAIEYLKAMNNLNSHMKPIIIKRSSNNYNSKLLDNDNFSSASAIRYSILNNHNYNIIKNSIPENIYNYISTINPLSNDDALNIIYYMLNLYKYKKKNLNIYLDINTNLSNRILNSFENVKSYEQLISLIKTKDYTYSRISRAVTHILLNIQKEKFKDFYKQGASYARLLAFKKSDIEVLTLLKNRTSLNFISKEKDAKKLSKMPLELYKHNQFANNIYKNIYYSKYMKELGNSLLYIE